mgnify:CR=1 FL=1
MKILEYGKERDKTLLFLPCTAEPEWAFTDAVTRLAREYRVVQVIYDGHGETGEDFVSVEMTVDEVTDRLRRRGITRLDAAYGCSLGGACLTRLLALGEIPVGRAIFGAFGSSRAAGGCWRRSIRPSAGHCRGAIPQRNMTR